MKYLARLESEDSRATFIRPFQDALNIPEGETPLSEDEGKRREVLRLVLGEVKGLGEGNDRGTHLIFRGIETSLPLLVLEIEGFFNLLYCHLLALYPPDSPESTELVTSLLGIVTSSAPSEQTSVKYRL